MQGLMRRQGSLWVKVCGFTQPDEAYTAAQNGVDAIGLVFAESRRRVTTVQAAEIVRQLPPSIVTIGVFVDASFAQIMDVVQRTSLQVIQLHGSESPALAQKLIKEGLPVIKLIKADSGKREEAVSAYQAIGVESFLFDANVPGMAGGTGSTCDWVAAAEVAANTRLVLAGGLHIGNLAAALRQVHPWGVDVSSGVEDSPGHKNTARVAEFVRLARACDYNYSNQLVS